MRQNVNAKTTIIQLETARCSSIYIFGFEGAAQFAAKLSHQTNLSGFGQFYARMTFVLWVSHILHFTTLQWCQIENQQSPVYDMK